MRPNGQPSPQCSPIVGACCTATRTAKTATTLGPLAASFCGAARAEPAALLVTSARPERPAQLRRGARVMFKHSSAGRAKVIPVLLAFALFGGCKRDEQR